MFVVPMSWTVSGRSMCLIEMCLANELESRNCVTRVWDDWPYLYWRPWGWWEEMTREKQSVAEASLEVGEWWGGLEPGQVTLRVGLWGRKPPLIGKSPSWVGGGWGHRPTFRPALNNKTFCSCGNVYISALLSIVAIRNMWLMSM